jgi:hypothetical protein
MQDIPIENWPLADEILIQNDKVNDFNDNNLSSDEMDMKKVIHWFWLRFYDSKIQD